MGDNEDESTSSNSKARRSNRRRQSKPKDPSTELNDMEKEELLRTYAATDRNLEKFAQAHNMTALNVKSVLRSLIKNHRALARVLGTDAPDESTEGVRITRSKTRALQDSSHQQADMSSITMERNFPIKTFWVDFSFNEDDEYDNDYRPDEEDSGDDIESDSSHLESFDDDESASLSGLEEHEEDVNEDEHEVGMVDNVEDDWMGESGDYPVGTRPHSVASLTLNASVGEEDEPSIDYNWFLDNIKHGETIDDDDDNEEDPDYTVPAEDIFIDETEDLVVDYWTSTIPTKEVEDLFVDIVPTERLEELANNLDPPMRHLESVRPATSVEVRTLSPTEVIKEDERIEYSRDKIFTDHHRSQLHAQMEQHVQLLTQSYVGCYFEPLLQEEKEIARGMIRDLSDMAAMTWHLGSKSAFHISNLSYAVDTCNRMEKVTLDAPIRPLAKEHLVISHAMLSNTKEVLSTSQAILYPHLVSRHRLVQSIGSSGWHHNEIILFAMALNRYKEEPEKHRLPRQGKYSIIAENCLPWRVMNELRWQYNGLKRAFKRNGRTSYNTQFFDVAEGNIKLTFPRHIRAKLGWTMEMWPKNCLPSWYTTKRTNKQAKRKMEDMERNEDDAKPKRKRRMKERKEKRIDDGDNEIEPIVIVDSDEEEGGRRDEDEDEQDENEGRLEMESEGGDEEEVTTEEDTEDRREKEKENRWINSLLDDECAMDSIEKNRMERSPEEMERVRGEEKEGETEEGQPIDFSHLMSEMSPRVRSSRSSRQTTQVKAVSPMRITSNTPDEISIFPPTPGKRIPSPSEDSMPWLEMTDFRRGFDSPPLYMSPPSGSRIKTPGGTMDYVDSLMGYFGTPEREMDTGKDDEGEIEEQANKRLPYSNLFGDFDFDESDEDEETREVAVNDDNNERRDEEMEGLSDDVAIDMDEECDANPFEMSEEPLVKQKKKRPTREEKEKIGLAAIGDWSLRRRVMAALARKAAEDIRGRMTMHSSVFRQIQKILCTKKSREDRDKILSDVLPLLSTNHREVLYLLSAFSPPSSLPRSLVLSQGRLVYVAVFDMMCTIYAYMSKIQRKLSYRQLMRMIVDAYGKGGTEKTLEVLNEVLVNDPLLLRVLTNYYTPTVPSKKSKGWEVIDLRKGEEAFNILMENGSIERVDLCEVMGGVPTKRMIVKTGKTLSNLMLNHDGEPILKNEDGKYKEIAVMSEIEMEEERRRREVEREEEKKARVREKTKERMKAVKKAKMVERREERAREKKKEVEKRQEEEERKKEEKGAPPTHPFNREVDRALLVLYNQVQKVTKRAVRKMVVDLPYSANFTLEQLQSRLDFLLSMAKEG